MLRDAFKFMWFDKAKMFGILFGMILSVFLVGQQMMICLALLGSTVSLATFNQQYIWVVSPKSKQVTDLPSLDMRLARSLMSVEGVFSVHPLVFSGGNLKLADGKKFPITMIGTQAPEFAGGPWNISSGNPFDMFTTGGIFLDKANTEFGKLVSIGQYVELNGVKMRIVGLTERTEGLGVPYAFSSIEKTRAITNFPATEASAFLIKWKRNYSASSVVRAITRVIPSVKALTGKEFRSQSLKYFATSSGIVASFGLLVVFAIITGFSIVGLTMYSAVSDRIKDYGTLKAIGANNGKIRKLILLQASIYAVTGFILAYGLLIFFINATEGSLDLQLTPILTYALIIVTLFIAVMGSLFGMRKITKLEPAAVFR
ncbi:MAG: FtsX-like permease family protein [Saprospiraceae bacterium]|nr:FtsX-like permease family protein [Saprospiraceae bacterium]